MRRSIQIAIAVATFGAALCVGALYRSCSHDDGLSEQDFYLHKMSWRGGFDLVIAGDSRVARGVSPEGMQPMLADHRIANLGFNANSLVYAPYLDHVEHALDPKSHKRAILIGVDPYELTPRSTKNNGFVEYSRKAPVQRGDPRIPTLRERVQEALSPLRIRNAAVLGETTEVFHDDGFIETDRSPIDESARLSRYRVKFEGNSVDRALAEVLFEAVERWSGQGIRVLGFEPPISRGLLAVELELSGFDRPWFVAEFERRGGLWVSDLGSGYQTYDGEHLTSESAAKLSAQLARAVDERSASTALAHERQQQLIALGYATWDEVEGDEQDKTGVTLHDKSDSSPGVNYYCSESSGTMQFLDMEGTVLYSISADISETSKNGNKCKLVEFGGSDGLVMLVEDIKLIGLGFDSSVRWQRRGRFHHDVDVLPDGTIFALSAKEVPSPRGLAVHRTVLDNLVISLDARGKELEAWSIAPMVAEVPALKEKGLRHLRRTAQRVIKHDDPRDFLHLNSLEVVRHPVQYEGGLRFEAGDLLFCSRYLDSIGVIDPKERRIKWHWGTDQLEWPHHASLLSNGNMMLFDNGASRGFSRVLIIAPNTGEVVWSYQAEPPQEFFSSSRGGAQLLDNGNVLITDSDHGRVFEVTRDGKIVWEFWNPDFNDDKTARATIYRMMRLNKREFLTYAMPEEVRGKLQRVFGD